MASNEKLYNTPASVLFGRFELFVEALWTDIANLDHGLANFVQTHVICACNTDALESGQTGGEVQRGAVATQSFERSFCLQPVVGGAANLEFAERVQGAQVRHVVETFWWHGAGLRRRGIGIGRRGDRRVRPYPIQVIVTPPGLRRPRRKDPARIVLNVVKNPIGPPNLVAIESVASDEDRK